MIQLNKWYCWAEFMNAFEEQKKDGHCICVQDNAIHILNEEMETKETYNFTKGKIMGIGVVYRCDYIEKMKPRLKKKSKDKNK